jgi:predicted flap endonuclease-1-like 5' DNA nuclease
VANDAGVIGSLTTIHLILIALLAVVTIIAIIFAARIRARAKRQRLEAGEASERLIEISEVDAPTAPPPPPLADTPPAFTETPSPPSDIPVVAAAPLDAAPATLAGDMEPVRAAPEAGHADDLTRMKGIGPKLAAQLAAQGYASYARIAALSPAEADTLDAQLGAFKGRLARDRVVEQAGYLAKGDTAGFESVFGKL